MSKYRLVKTNNNKYRTLYYSIQKKTMFGWKEIDGHYIEKLALISFDNLTAPLISEVIIEKEV